MSHTPQATHRGKDKTELTALPEQSTSRTQEFIMNRKHLLAAAVLAFAGASAFAGGEFDPMRDYNLPSTPSKLTRAEVAAEVARAQAAGELNTARDSALPVERTAKAPSTVSREQVRAEARAALHAPRRGTSLVDVS